MITARGLTRKFGEQTALDGIDLTVERGEMFGLIGPDGAGKTTFFRIAAGLAKPTSGTMTMEPGVDFGFVPQRFSLYEDLTVSENLRLRARLYGVPDQVAAERQKDLLGRVGMERFERRLAGALSGGMKQKLALVAALLTRPQLLLLDEPTTGVDPVSRREFWLLLNALHHEGLTIVISTPYMDEAEYATRIAFLDHGRIVSTGTRSEVLGRYSRALLAIRSSERLEVRRRLATVDDVDDVSLFGTTLHVRGRNGDSNALMARVREALSGVVPPDGVQIVPPSLEDVFVLAGEEVGA